MINDTFLLAGICSAEYSYISKWVVHLLAPPTNPDNRLCEKFLL